MTYYSRLQRKRQKDNTKQTALFVVGSIVVVVLLFFFGFKAVFGLTGFLSERFKKQSGTVTQNNLTPTTPVFSEDFDATKSATITISGVTDPKTNVELFQNGQSMTTGISDDQGKFSFDINLIRGENKFQAQATSDQGAKSDNSDEYSVWFLSSPPSLDVSSPKDGDTVRDQLTPIVGSTDPGVKITVNDLLSIVDDNGKFSYGFNFVSGDNHIKVVATDRAGNQTTKEFTVHYSP